MTATPSQEWTQLDEANLGFYAGLIAFGPCDPCSAKDAATYAREILRLRADNERLVREALEWMKTYDACARESNQTIASLRSQLAATREGEAPRLVGDPLRPKIDGAVVTPVHDAECPTVRQRDSECTCGGMQAAARAAHYKGYPDVRSTTSRSRESDNGK